MNTDTMEMKDRMLSLSVDKIQVSKWDIRKYPENTEAFNSLKESIHEDGLLNPVTVTKQGEVYILVAGRRRLRACKELGMKNVPAYVKSDSAEQWENDLVTIIENLHRRELKDYERSYGILHAYTIAGYTKEEAISGTRYLHNHLELFKSSGLDTAKTKRQTLNMRQELGKIFVPDAKFIQIARKIGYSPVWQWRLLELTRDLDVKVLEKADHADLSTGKKMLLTHTKLREHPEVQKHLVAKLANKQSEATAKEEVRQTISDLETGYIKPSKSKKTYTLDGSADRDVIKGNKQIVKQPQDHYMRIKADSNKLLYSLTGRKIAKGEYQYNKETINYTRTHRLDIAKSMDSDYRTLRVFKETYLDLVKLAVDDMIKIVEAEMDNSEEKKKLMSK